MLPVLPALALIQRASHLSGRVRSKLVMLAFLAAAYVGLVLYELVRGPLVLRSMRPSDGYAKRMIRVGEGETIPTEIRDFLTASRAALQRLGFNQLALMRSESVNAYLALASDAAGVLATTIALASKKGALSRLVGFTTRLASGALVRTTNTDNDSPWPTRAGDDVVRVPEPDLVRLRAIHGRRVARHVAKGARIAPIVVTDPVAYQFEEERESLERAVASGYYVREGTQKRITWKGACINAWQYTHPFRELRQWLRERHHRALLREIGVGA